MSEFFFRLTRRVTFGFLVLIAVESASAQSHAQAVAESSTDTAPVVNAQTNSAPLVHAQILFTGKLMGYMRIPDQQGFEMATCPNVQNSGGSSGVTEFLEELRKERRYLTDKKLFPVLVGMGDNFAPEYEARILHEPQDRKSPANTNFDPGRPEKYFYTWDWLTDPKNPGWILNETFENKIRMKDPIALELNHAINQGDGQIGADNVGCFLKAARYVAVVPGKHDFYFGPQALLSFARFLAKPDRENPDGVQMLGANLVVRTEYSKTHTPLPDEYRELPFKKKSDLIQPVNVNDKDSVLPWMRFARFQISLDGVDDPSPKTPKDVENVIESIKVCIIESETGHPENFKNPRIDACPRKGLVDHWDFDQGKSYDMLPGKCPSSSAAAETNVSPKPFCWNTDADEMKSSGPPEGNKEKKPEIPKTAYFDVDLTDLSKFMFMSDEPNDPPRDLFLVNRSSTYALCLFVTTSKEDKTGGPPYCVRFTVDSPFFQFPRPYEKKNAFDKKKYTEPGPYAVTENQDGTEVAVFGVVDPAITQMVGQLNLIWDNTDDRYVTRVESISPLKAIEQVLQYFEWAHHDKPFHGAKILLAQMSAPLADQLRSHYVGVFNTIISEAQEEAKTPTEDITVNSIKPDIDPSNPVAPGRPTPELLKPTIRVVPEPQFNLNTYQRVVNMSSVEITELPKNGDMRQWTFNVKEAANLLKTKGEEKKSIYEMSRFKTDVDDGAGRKQDKFGTGSCPDKLDPKNSGRVSDSKPAYDKCFQTLVLKAMQDEYKSDIALLQQRDFFGYRTSEADTNAATLPQIIDEILWKGDLLVRLHITGSTIKAILDESNKFQQDDQDALSLSDERGKALVSLGVSHALDGQSWLINGEALDPNRLYSVATTDFIGLGDTGYPELQKTDLGDPVDIREQDHGNFRRISARVCDWMKQKTDTCGNPVLHAYDFDSIHDAPTDQTSGNTTLLQLVQWTGFRPPSDRVKPVPPSKFADLVEQKQQDRKYLFVSLNQLKVSFDGIRNNLTADQQNSRFAGVNTPSAVTAPDSHTVSTLDQVSWGWKSQHWDLTQTDTVTFEQDGKAQANGPTLETLKNNQLQLDWQLFLHRDRQRRWGPIFGIHDDSNLLLPTDYFTVPLAGNPAEKGAVSAAYGRTNFATGRVGFRVEGPKSYIQFGYQEGWISRVTEYDFTPPTGSLLAPVQCMIQAGQAVSACIKAGGVDSSWRGTALLSPLVPRQGAFADFVAAPPLGSRMSLTLEQHFVWLRSRPNSLSTEPFAYTTTTIGLKYKVWNNICIQPEFDFFFFMNQQSFDTLTQKEYKLSLLYSFDWKRGTRWRDALGYSRQACQ